MVFGVIAMLAVNKYTPQDRAAAAHEEGGIGQWIDYTRMEEGAAPTNNRAPPAGDASPASARSADTTEYIAEGTGQQPHYQAFGPREA